MWPNGQKQSDEAASTDASSPRVPDGWQVSESHGETKIARKWFGDHYKEVAVADSNGPDALFLAADSVDKEHGLRVEATVQAAVSTADALDAQAAAVRATGDSNASAPIAPEEAPPVAPVHETVEPTPPIVVPSVEELRAAPSAT